MTMMFAIDLLRKNTVPQVDPSQHTLKVVLTDVFVFLGAIAFLILVLSGLRYILARGSAEKITQAKNSIMYSLIGLVVAALASAIVNVILDQAK